jgi:hypothetical protein
MPTRILTAGVPDIVLNQDLDEVEKALKMGCDGLRQVSGKWCRRAPGFDSARHGRPFRGMCPRWRDTCTSHVAAQSTPERKLSPVIVRREENRPLDKPLEQADRATQERKLALGGRESAHAGAQVFVRRKQVRLGNVPTLLWPRWRAPLLLITRRVLTGVELDGVLPALDRCQGTD